MQRRESSRRRAQSNYIRVENEPALAHLQSFRGLNANGNANGNANAPQPGTPTAAQPSTPTRQQQYQQQQHDSGTPPAGRAPPPPTTTDIFETLQAKFGFQRSSVENQKEHFVYWLTNYQLRVQHEQIRGSTLTDVAATRIALGRVHKKFFKNYVWWCKFLRTKPYLAGGSAKVQHEQQYVDDANSALVMEKQLALFLLIWGEAGNMRFMPECICFLYHSMANKLDEVEYLPNVEEGFYLTRIVRPIYDVISIMRTAAAPEGAKPLDHQDVTNYDDVNEFFWTTACLDFDELNVAEALKVHDPKTFKEKRSLFNPLLAFFRIWFFLVVMFHVLFVIVYVSYRADNSDSGGLSFYGNFFSTSQTDLRAHAIYSIFVTITGLLALKVGLQMWLYGMRIFKDAWLVIGVFFRLFWHTFFFALFVLVNVSPSESALFGSKSSILSGGGDSGTYLSMGLLYVIVYSIPVVFSAFLRMFCAHGIWSIRILNGLDGTRRQYIGRKMAQPWAAYSQYALSWMVIFVCKFAFNLQFMVKPLVGPSIVVYDIAISDEQRSNGIIESNHNIAFIIALWVPVFVVYMYDSQIYFILFQTIVGLVMGIRMKLGHYIDLPQLKAGLYAAPDQFDLRVTTTQAKLVQQEPAIASGSGKVDGIDHVRLRFAIIWNEVISNFRLNDLLDDRETVMLQYRILGKGEQIEDPIFLLAGSLTKAITLASSTSTNKWDTQSLIKNFENAKILDGVKDGLYLLREIFTLLLGDADEQDGAVSVLEHLFNSPDIVSMIDFSHLPELADEIEELLGTILDMPEDLAAFEDNNPAYQSARIEFQVQVGQVTQSVRNTFKIVGKMLNDGSLVRKLENCKFLQFTPDLGYQKQQLLSLYQADVLLQNGFFSAHRRENDESCASSSRFAREDFVSGCTRLFILMRLDVANSLPRCDEAKRRMGFFLHSLAMDMPQVQCLEAMPSFSVMTPYYSETVLFTLDELKNPVHSNPLFEAIDKKATVKGRSELSIIKYLIALHAEEWSNFLERMSVGTLEEAIATVPMQVRLWASLRGQTLARTVQGMMMYEDAIRLLRWLELYAVAGMNEDTKAYEMSRISALKFSYITGCQIYSQQVAKGDHRADDIDFLMKKYPSWRVSFVDTIKDNGATRFDCVLVKSEGDEIVEVYRYELPGNPILGEGKPENQNVALPFTRGEYLQTIDMNQEHYFEETLKMPNFLATATSSGEEVTIIGMKEHVFTGRASSLARFMTQQELVFVTLTQRVLARPLRARMHYGHPDVFEKSFVMTSGGVSKASKGINLSEDVFSGYNVTLRGGLVTHVEFMQCGKGRDVTLSQINAFEAKLSNGCAESCLSREGHRMSNNLDFFRLNSMFYGHFGFYICNALTVLCVYIYAYAKLYVATHEEIQINAVMTSNSLNSLATVMSTQYILQFGMLTTLPLLATLVVEFGLKEASFRVLELISTLGIVFYVFLTGTKAHFYDVALIRGGSKYRGTGRGFAITRDPMVNFFKEYNVSHFRKAVELIGVMILFGMCGNFNIGAGARAEYCASVDFCEDSPDLIPANITALDSYSRSPQGYGVASFAVLLLGACWLMAPFLFNTDGLVLNKTNIDISNWFAWMMRVKQDDDLIEDDDKNSSGVPKDGWLEWWAADVDLMSNLGPMGRATYCLRELRHPLAMYYVFITEFSLTDMIWLIAAIIFIWIGLVLGGVAIQSTLGKKQKLAVLTVRGIVYMAVVVGGLGIVPIIIGGVAGWYVTKSLVLSSAIFLGLNSICQFALALHGVYGFPLALTRPVVALGFLFDMLVGVFLVVPLLALSFLPFMRILQSRMLYNGGFSRALSSGSEVAASLVIILGLVAGFVHGFMTCFVYGLGYLNSSSDNFVNSSFHSFVTTSLSDSASDHLLTWMKDGYLKTVCAGASIVAVLASLALSRFFGRRWSMVSGCVCIGSSMVLNFISSSSVIILACALGASGTAILSMNYLMYSFEICTKGWRGKSVVLYLLGSMFGYLVHALMQKSVDASTLSTGSTDNPTNDWRVAPLYVAAPLTILLCGILKFMPESPVWLIRHNHQKHARRVLARLRQREDVQMDMTLIEEELKASVTKENNLAFRIAFVFVLQILVGLLMSQGLLLREQLRESSKASGPRYSNWLVYFSICSASGLSFGIFLVDNVRRKTILKEFLPFVGLLSLFCGISGSLANGQSGFVQAMLFIMYIAAGLSLLSAAWLSAMEMFPTSNRPLLFTTSLCVFHLTEAIVFFTRPSFAATHFIFCILCGAVTAVLFMFCASTKTGAIQLKTEKKRQKEAQAAADAAAIVAAGLNDAQAQGDNQLHFRRQQSRFTRNNSANVSRRVPYLDPTGESSDNIMSADGSVNFDESSSNGSRSPKAPYVTRVSDSFDLIDEFDGPDDSRTQNLLTHEISYPVQQPRSVSFLRSQSFPDADIKTETLYKKL